MRVRGRGVGAVLLALVAGLVVAGWAAPAVAAPGATGDGWPLDGSPAVLHGFDPPAQRWLPGHRGVDLAARPGQRVLAPGSGRVVFAGQVAGRPVLVLEHDGLRTTLEPVVAEVRVGQQVAAGQPVGRVGHEAHCDDRCLHWGLRRGEEYLDPLAPRGPPAVPGGDGTLRLVPASRRAVVEREAAARAAAEAAARMSAFHTTGTAGPPGAHGFLHPVPGAITSPFGMRFHPVLHVLKLHDGTDFGAACGTPIRAPYAGRVTQVYAGTGYGNRLFLDHGTVDGHAVETSFNHALRYVVGPGEHVARGQLLGYVGSTGFSTGCHLHLMLWLDGRMVDPMGWL